MCHGNTSDITNTVKSAVAEVYSQIHQDHCKIYEINYKHISRLAQHKLCGNAGSITEYKQQDERQAHTLCTSAAVVLHQIDRP